MVNLKIELLIRSINQPWTYIFIHHYIFYVIWLLPSYHGTWPRQQPCCHWSEGQNNNSSVEGELYIFFFCRRRGRIRRLPFSLLLYSLRLPTAHGKLSFFTLSFKRAAAAAATCLLYYYWVTLANCTLTAGKLFSLKRFYFFFDLRLWNVITTTGHGCSSRRTGADGSHDCLDRAVAGFILRLVSSAQPCEGKIT